jgi:asparaginyl-tRNA synthetase
VPNFDAAAEVSICELVGKGQPVFVLGYPLKEVAFYHAAQPRHAQFAINADLLFPGFGEIIGCGQRVLTKKDLEKKFALFDFPKNDYRWYGEIRDQRLGKVIHSGFGMGIERFLTSILRLPSVYHATAFPRVSNSLYP